MHLVSFHKYKCTFYALFYNLYLYSIENGFKLNYYMYISGYYILESLHVQST